MALTPEAVPLRDFAAARPRAGRPRPRHRGGGPHRRGARRRGRRGADPDAARHRLAQRRGRQRGGDVGARGALTPRPSRAAARPGPAHPPDAAPVRRLRYARHEPDRQVRRRRPPSRRHSPSSAVVPPEVVHARALPVRAARLPLAVAAVLLARPARGLHRRPAEVPDAVAAPRRPSGTGPSRRPARTGAVSRRRRGLAAITRLPRALRPERAAGSRRRDRPVGAAASQK